MKTNRCLKTLLFAVLGGMLASPLSATPPQTPTTMYLVKAVKTRSEVIKVGTTRIRVEWFLGSPQHKISPSVWVYHNFRADRPDAIDNQCRSLVVTFAGEYVRTLRLVNEDAVTVITAQIAKNPAAIPAMLVASAR